MKHPYITKNIYQYLATLSGSLAVLTSGINLGWTSPYLPGFLDGSDPDFFMTSAEGSWCAVMPLVGAPVGAFIVAKYVDIVGRKRAILYLAPITVLAFITLAFNKSVALIFVVRFIIGSAEGALYTVLPMYLGEISNPSIRGILSASLAIATTTGMLFINALGFYCSIFVSSLICSLIPAIHFLTFIWMPESPYFLLKIGNQDDARKSLQILRGIADVDQELKTLSDVVARQEGVEKAKFTDLFTVKSNLRAFLIFAILNLTRKLSGKNALIFYTSSIFHAADGVLDPKLSVLITIFIEVLATAASVFLIDRLGRKPIIIFSAIGCALALATVGVYFYLLENQEIYLTNLNWIPIAALTFYNICYSSGLEVTGGVYLSELFPTNIKAVALAFADTFSVFNGTVAGKLFQVMADNFGIYTPFWIFSGCCITGTFFIIKYVPETKNKTLEEIQNYLIRKTTKGNCTGDN